MKNLFGRIGWLFLFPLTLNSLSSQPLPSIGQPLNNSTNGIQSVTLFTDQDFFAKSLNEDRNYTMGFKIILQGELTNKNWWLGVPLLRKGLDFLTSVEIDDLQPVRYYSLSLKGTAFTPLDICTNDGMVDIEDRPFSFLLGLSSSRRTEFDFPKQGNTSIFSKNNRNKDFSITNSLTLGILGLDIGKGFQTWSHRVHLFGSTREVPCLWDTQIGEGGELTGLINVSSEKPLLNIINKGAGLSTLRVLISGSGEVNLGYYTNMAVGLDFGFGRFIEDFLSSEDLFDSSINAQMNESTVGAWRVVGGIRLRGVLYNAHLMGQFKDNIHEFSNSKIEKAIIEYYLGIRLIPLKGLEIIYLPLVSRSPEFNTSLSRNHYWGTLSLTFNLN